MFKTVSTARDMIAGMNPELRPGRFVFVTVPPGVASDSLREKALASFREAEGLSLLLPEDVAAAEGLQASEPMCQITLNVFSSLTGVGLTAAVATALAKRGIACNLIAATLHDHVFVPATQADAAMETLARLEAEAGSRSGLAD